MVPFAIFFHYAYSVRPYYIRPRDPDAHFPRSYQGGPLGIYAWLGMWNIGEILSAIGFAFNMASEQQKQRQSKRGDEAGYNLLDRQKPVQPYQPIQPGQPVYVK